MPQVVGPLPPSPSPHNDRNNKYQPLPHPWPTRARGDKFFSCTAHNTSSQEIFPKKYISASKNAYIYIFFSFVC